MRRHDSKEKHYEDAASDIRVTDRRRIQLDDNGETDRAASFEPPSLKPSYVEELETRTKAAEQRVQEVQSRFEQLRKQLQNETDETRQRLNRAADERAQREKVDFIAELLPVLDNLQQAVEVAKDDPSNPIVEGLRGVLANFESSLAGAGVEPIEAINEEFNPELHEAVEISAVEPEMDGRVVGEYSRGYRIGDRLLRAARVKVGRYSENTNRVAS